jgi:hypothetical protein
VSQAGYVLVPRDFLSDDRFAVLAQLLGLPGGAEQARGLFLRLLALCAATQHFTLAELRIEAILGPGGVEALLRAHLGQYVPVHQPSVYGAGMGMQPTLAAAGECVIRIEYAQGAIEFQGRQIKAAHGAAEKRMRKYREAEARAVDNAEDKLSEPCDQPSKESTDGVPMGDPKGEPVGNPSGAPHACASEIRTRSLRDPEPEGDSLERRAMRGGLRVVNGADREGSGS